MPAFALAGVAVLVWAAGGCAPAENRTDGRALARIAARGELLWGADEQGGEPYAYEDPARGGALIGFEVDLAEALARSLGVRARMVQNDWPTLIPSLERGTFDVALNGIEVTPARAGPRQLHAPLLHLRRAAGRPPRRRSGARLALVAQLARRNAGQHAGLGSAARDGRRPRPLRGGRRAVRGSRARSHGRRAARRHHRRPLRRPPSDAGRRRRRRRGALRDRAAPRRRRPARGARPRARRDDRLGRLAEDAGPLGARRRSRAGAGRAGGADPPAVVGAVARPRALSRSRSRSSCCSPRGRW